MTNWDFDTSNEDEEAAAIADETWTRS